LGVRLVTVTVTVTGTAGVKKSLLGIDSWIAAAEEVSLQTASEGGKRRAAADSSKHGLQRLERPHLYALGT